MKNKDLEKPSIMVCVCSSTEHQIVFTYDKELNQIYCHIHLVERSFFKRLWNGLKYIFGYKCKYGHFDEFILDERHVDTLKEMSKTLKRK